MQCVATNRTILPNDACLVFASQFILARIPTESRPHHLGTARSQANSAATSSKVRDAITPAVSPGGWCYCGSHNFTAAAWGKVTRSAKTKEIQLFCYNW